MGIFDIFRRKEKKDPVSSGGPRGQTGDRERSDKKIQDLIDNKDKYQNNQVAGDNRNEYQMRMNALRTGQTFDPSQFAFTDNKGNQINPGSDNKTIGNAGGSEAYGDRFPISNFAMEGLPKIIGNLASAGTPFGLIAPIARYIYNSGPGQDVRGMATDTIKNPIMSGINNAGEITGDVIEKLQSKFNNWNVSQGKKANPDFIPKKRVGPNIFDVSGEVEDKGVSNYFDIAAENAAIDPTEAGRRSDNVSAGPYDSGFEIMNLKDSGVSAGPYDSVFATTEEVVEPLAELSENERIIQNYEDEFMNTYGRGSLPFEMANKLDSEYADRKRAEGDPDYLEGGIFDYDKSKPGVQTFYDVKSEGYPSIPSYLRDSILGDMPINFQQRSNLPYEFIRDKGIAGGRETYDTAFQDVPVNIPADYFSDVRSYLLPEAMSIIPKSFNNGGYMSGFPNQNPAESLTASDNIDDRIMKNLQFEKMAPGMMGYNQGGEAKGIYEKLKSFNDHG